MAFRTTVLVVDDADMIRFVLRAHLEGLGYLVLEAKDGAEAIESFQRFGDVIDLVILDLNMPVVSGRKCFDQLRHLNPGVRIIVCSGSPLEDVPEDWHAAGAAGAIEKPFLLHEISDLVIQALGR